MQNIFYSRSRNGQSFNNRSDEARESGGGGRNFSPNALELALSSEQFLRELERHIERGGGDIEEILSEVLLILWIMVRSGRYQESKGTPAKLARGVARRVRLKLFRRATQRRTVALTDGVVDGRAGPVESAVAHDSWLHVAQALSDLNSGDQQLIRKRYCFDEPSDDAGPNSSSDRCRLSRAMTKLRQCLCSG